MRASLCETRRSGRSTPGAVAVALLCLVAVANGGFIPHFETSTPDKSNAVNDFQSSGSSASSSASSSGGSSDAVASASASSSSASSAVNDSPVIVTQTGPRRGSKIQKKIQITITKDIEDHHGGGHAGGHANAAPHAHGHNNNAHAAAGGGHHTTTAQGNPLAQLHLNNNAPFMVDNVTVATLLQQLLSGNVQSVANHGKPLALPMGGKPVAVIFSSAMHVVDLGDLMPPKHTVARTAAPSKHTAQPHNHTTAHAGGHAGTHAAFNHTSFLASLMSPLISLTHLHGGGPAAAHAHAQQHVPVQTVQAPMMQMQPVMMMMPMPMQGQMVPMQMTSFSQPQIMQMQTSSSSGSSSAASSTSPLITDGLQGILAAKQQLLASSGLLNHDHQQQQAQPAAHAGHAAHTTEGSHQAHTSQGHVSPKVAHVVEQPSGVPMEAPAKQKIHKFDFTITKRKEIVSS